MSGIKEWFVSGGVHLVLGFLLGWIVFKRPAWVENLIGNAETAAKADAASVEQKIKNKL